MKALDITSDITLSKGVLDVLDHSSPFPDFGNKIGVDLTARFKGEPPRKDKSYLKPPPSSADGLLSIVKKSLPGFVGCRHLFCDLLESKDISNRLLAVSVEKTKNKSGKDFAAMLFGSEELDMFNIFILFDREIDLSDGSLMLWKLFNNVDPGRDMIFHNDRVVIDACKKGSMDGHDREWPDELTFDIQKFENSL